MAEKDRPREILSGFPRAGVIFETPKPTQDWKDNRLSENQRIDLIRTELATFF